MTLPITPSSPGLSYSSCGPALVLTLLKYLHMACAFDPFDSGV